LIETLWPEWDPELANNNLKTAVHALRQTLNPLSGGKSNHSCILFSEGSYLINPEVGLWVDVEEFEQHWLTGRSLEKEGRLSEA
jgi:DNA-binding SARP family transcriptional activator